MADRILVKLRPATALRATESRAHLRPLYDPKASARGAFGLEGAPTWFVADVPDGAATPWDVAHGRLADQLGVAGSDIAFAEPDLVHDVYADTNERSTAPGFAIGKTCTAEPQDGGNGKVVGPDAFGWHLDANHSELDLARRSVTFTEPRTRIAHIDTGYYRDHETCPAHVQRHLERNFVRRDGAPESAQDPDNFVLLLDNSGHGTGTIGILAGNAVAAFGGTLLGGAYDAEIVPLRIADSVVLLRTSTLAEALSYAVEQRCDVATLSMGGLPSRVWNEAINEAYLAGLCLVAAAGNNVNHLPTRHMVYPARYGRVIAACGVMADGRPYADLTGIKTMEGNFGPASHMKTAMAAYSPNIPWPVFGCPKTVRLNGEGTSSATPQIAAAVALWFEKYKQVLPRDWRRVEAVREALFSTAASPGAHSERLGRGTLRAHQALAVQPKLNLPQTPADSDSFAFFRVLTGLGIAEVSPREEMFNLELAQRWLKNPVLQGLVPDPMDVAQLPDGRLREVMDAVIADDGASLALRKHVASRYPILHGGPAPRSLANQAVVPEVLPACDTQPVVRNPPHRRLRIYALDPSFSTRLGTSGASEVTLRIRWEDLSAPGPVGEYFAVKDVDPSGKSYEPVDLDAPALLAQDGWAPSEGNAQFHQQMIYAVGMRTVEHFERSLGRRVLWRHRSNPANPHDDSGFVRRITVEPHALRQANAFYSPEDVALRFGYFEAAADDPGDHVPGSRVYSCLSHDIIAHETTHAILDGIHTRFNEPTNADVLALHEGFADIVALLQHFTIPELLTMEIRGTRGDIEAESILGSLAVQFGRAAGTKGALRNAIGAMVDKKWQRLTPDPGELSRRITPHARGAILVAAVFDAFIAIYKTRTADLLRLATGGTGILPDGAIHPDLVQRLAAEAVTAAGHVLTMCIRALDYLPPVDVTFFEYLRALITADTDFISEDRYNYRVAFVEAFRARGIYPIGIDNRTSPTSRTLSVDTLRWEGLDLSDFPPKLQKELASYYGDIVRSLKRYANACLYLDDRKKLFEATRRERVRLHAQLKKAFKDEPEFAVQLGLDPNRGFEVHALRAAMRTRSDGKHVPQAIVALTQSKTVAAADGVPAYDFRGGSTLVIDLVVPELKYRIIKRIGSDDRQARTSDFVRRAADDPLLGLFFAPDRTEPFAALHALTEDGL